MGLATRLRRSSDPSATMSLSEHFGELRRRLLICAASVAVLAVVAFLDYNQILSFLRDPYCRANHGHCTLYVTSPLDGLSLRIKVALFGGMFLALPILLYQLWRFITPGLTKRERRYVVPFLAASLVLFAAGAALAYYGFEHALVFLSSIGGPGLEQIYNPNSYLMLILAMMLIFGLTFEFPVLLVGLELARVVRPAQLLRWWRWAVIGITVASALFTPSGDPFSMLILIVPLIAFYFLAILIGKLAKR
jgi:sec-independent protein translocase protein TatC